MVKSQYRKRGTFTLTCEDCGETFQDKWAKTRRCPKCHNRHFYLSWSSYLDILFNLREYISQGAELYYFDDTTIGNKSTECTWGLCGDQEQVYSADDCLWPKQYPGWVAPKHRQKGQYCPFDRIDHQSRIYEDVPIWNRDADGCFYRCRFFAPIHANVMTRESALVLIDSRIELARTWLREGDVRDLEGIE